jgi:hypothetical protein
VQRCDIMENVTILYYKGREIKTAELRHSDVCGSCGVAFVPSEMSLLCFVI